MYKDQRRSITNHASVYSGLSDPRGFPGHFRLVWQAEQRGVWCKWDCFQVTRNKPLFIKEDFGSRNRYVGHALIITACSVLMDDISYPYINYLILGLKSSYVHNIYAFGRQGIQLGTQCFNGKTNICYNDKLYTLRTTFQTSFSEWSYNISWCG